MSNSKELPKIKYWIYLKISKTTNKQKGKKMIEDCSYSVVARKNGGQILE